MTELKDETQKVDECGDLHLMLIQGLNLKLKLHASPCLSALTPHISKLKCILFPVRCWLMHGHGMDRLSLARCTSTNLHHHSRRGDNYGTASPRLK